MLTPPSTYGYASPSVNAMANYEQQQHVQSGERPKLLMQPLPPVLSEYSYMVHQSTPQHSMTPHHNVMTPQHSMTSKYDSEPILMTVPSTTHYFPSPQIGAQLLHVSSDYEYANGNVVTPSSARSSSKRSREDLNLKEKKRMFKLNDRINQLKDVLDEAGVQTKKNKQSILDNAAHYIEMLRSNLLVAKQKAERAEKQAATFRCQAQKLSSSGDKVVQGVFQKTTTPRVVVDMNMQTVMFNNAFVNHTGQSESTLKKLKTLQQYLCADQDTLHKIMKKVCETKQSISALVKTPTAGGNTLAVNLVAAVITDDCGIATNVEFSLIPFVTSQFMLMSKRQSSCAAHDDAETSTEESMTDGETKDNTQL